MTFRLFRGTGRFGPMSASAPPYVGRLHGVLAVLPSTRVASVAHVEPGQSFPKASATAPVRAAAQTGGRVPPAVVSSVYSLAHRNFLSVARASRSSGWR